MDNIKGLVSGALAVMADLLIRLVKLSKGDVRWSVVQYGSVMVMYREVWRGQVEVR